MTDQSEAKLPRLSLQDNDLLLRLLRDGQHLLLYNPRTAQSILQALVAEGRHFAQTPDGRLWQQKIAESDIIKKGRLIWQAFGLDNLLKDEPDIIPSEWLEHISKALDNTDLETMLSQLIREISHNGTPIRSS